MPSKDKNLAALIVEAIAAGGHLKTIARRSGRAHLVVKKNLSLALKREIQGRLPEILEALGWDGEVQDSCMVCRSRAKPGHMVIGCGVCGHSSLEGQVLPPEIHLTECR